MPAHATYLYGVFIRSKWALTCDRAQAVRTLVKSGLPGEVRELQDDPAYSSFDAPTFRVLSDVVVKIEGQEERRTFTA